MSVKILRPVADGEVSAFIIKYPLQGYFFEKVDEEIYDESTYLYTQSANFERCLFVLPDGGEGKINSVSLNAYCRSSAPPTGIWARPVIKTHSTIYTGYARSVGFSYELVSEVWTTNPYTGDRWTWDEMDDIQVGIDLAVNLGVKYSAIVTQLWVEVDRASAPGASISRGIFRGMFNKMR